MATLNDGGPAEKIILWDWKCHHQDNIVGLKVSQPTKEFPPCNDGGPAKNTPMPQPRCGWHLEALDCRGPWVDGYTRPNTINANCLNLSPTYGFTSSKPPYSISPPVCWPRRLSRLHTRWETTDLVVTNTKSQGTRRQIPCLCFYEFQ
jgi:hypothetical protein